MRTYELMLIARPDLDEEGITALLARVQQLMTDNGGEVIKAEPLGRRKLAFPIKKHREGVYLLMHANLTQTAIAEMERVLKLSEDILRYLLVKLEVANA